MTAASDHIAICVCTFNRPAGLRALLQALERLDTSQMAGQIHIVVVDNSGDGNAGPVCEAHAARTRFGSSYVHEKRRGLAYARNAALGAARSLQATHIAFIDDDEVPEPHWLEHLRRALASPDIGAAIGPVHPIFAVPPSRWLPVDAYTVRTRVEDGRALEGYTCNCLIAMEAVASGDLHFDLRFNETGGEDTLFFERLRNRGLGIAWVESAVVHEFVPQSRMSPLWLWRRWYRTGTIEAHLGRHDTTTTLGRLVNLGRGLARLLAGSGRIALSLLFVWRGRDRVVASFYTACRGAGLIANVLGRDYREYSRPGYR